MRRMLWGAGALVVVVAVAVGAWLLWRPSPDRTAEDCATARGMWDRYYTANEEFEALATQTGHGNSDVAARYDRLLDDLQRDAESITTLSVRQNADAMVAENRVLRKVWQGQVESDGSSDAELVRDFLPSARKLASLRDDLDGLCSS